MATMNARGAIFVFPYPSKDDTFRFPALFAGCSGWLRARGIDSRVVEVRLDVADSESNGKALKAFEDYVVFQKPSVVVIEDVFEPALFEIAGKAGARIVLTHPTDVFPAGTADLVIDSFSTDPLPAAKAVEMMLDGIDPAGVAAVLPNARLPGDRPSAGESCAEPLMFDSKPDYDFVSVPGGARPLSGRLSVYVNPGCPWAADASDNPVFAGIDLSGRGIAARGCSFCSQNGSYRGLSAEETVSRIMLELAEWRRFHPQCRELVVWDESPWRFLPLLVERAVDEAGPVTICFHARADHLVRRSDVIEQACVAARKNPDAAVTLALTLVGFENYSAAELERMNKGTVPQDLSDAAAACRRIADRYPDVFEYDRFKTSSFILFTPWTRIEDVRANIDGFIRDDISEFSTGMGLTRLRLYPNLPLFHLAAAQGLLESPESVDDAVATVSSAAKFGYPSDRPWRFISDETARVHRLYAALYPVVERNAETDLLAWCVRMVESRAPEASRPDEAAAVFERLLKAVAILNAAGSSRRQSGERVQQTEIGGVSGGRIAADAGSQTGNRRGHTLELTLSGSGIPHCGRAPDISKEPSPARTAVRIAVRGAGASMIHVIGIEPTRSPVFLRSVYLARQHGIPRAAVRTDGLVFEDPAALARAVKAGLTDIEMRVFGHDAATWAAITSGSGDFDRFRRAAGLIRSSASVVRGRALVELGHVLPESVDSVLSMLAEHGPGRVSWEAPVACLPVDRFEEFVSGIETLARSIGLRSDF